MAHRTAVRERLDDLSRRVLGVDATTAAETVPAEDDRSLVWRAARAGWQTATSAQTEPVDEDALFDFGGAF